MPRVESEELVRKHVWLYAKDAEEIEAMFAKSLGFSKAFRLIVRKFLEQAKNKALMDARTVAMDVLEDTDPLETADV